ncbi:MAG: DUF4282 domain-containing protein, partial [Planctomycetes bacterium]|nr:DUF4282 domain-containing protein [Planctomycetota bacterium]
MTDAETGWYLRHRDGVEHGPFRFADIIAAAKLGNLASDTCVRHEQQTLGQWVFAPRVGTIAEVMAKATPRPVQARQSGTTARTVPAARRAPARKVPTVSDGEPAAVVSEPARSTEPMPVVRPYREQGYPVPKTFMAACAALLDFRFRSFVTPWIAGILWAFSVLCSILWTGKLAYENLVPAAPPAAEIGTRGEWQFEPLGEQPFLQSTFLRFVFTVSAVLVGLLCIRVGCEAAVVLLRAANDLHDLKSKG